MSRVCNAWNEDKDEGEANSRFLNGKRVPFMVYIARLRDYKLGKFFVKCYLCISSAQSLETRPPFHLIHEVSFLLRFRVSICCVWL